MRQFPAYAQARTRIVVFAWQRCAGGRGWARAYRKGNSVYGRQAAGCCRDGSGTPIPSLGGSTGPSPAPARDGRPAPRPRTQARALGEAGTDAPLPCLIADRAQDRDGYRAWQAQRDLEAAIPARRGRTNPQPRDPERYPARQAAEQGRGRSRTRKRSTRHAAWPNPEACRPAPAARREGFRLRRERLRADKDGRSYGYLPPSIQGRSSGGGFPFAHAPAADGADDGHASRAATQRLPRAGCR